MNDDENSPSPAPAKEPYEAPSIVTSAVFETLAMSCTKRDADGDPGCSIATLGVS